MKNFKKSSFNFFLNVEFDRIKNTNHCMQLNQVPSYDKKGSDSHIPKAFKIGWHIENFPDISTDKISQVNLCNQTKVKSILIIPENPDNKMKFQVLFRNLPSKSTLFHYKFILNNQNSAKNLQFERRVDVEEVVDLPITYKALCSQESGFLIENNLDISILVFFKQATSKNSNPLPPPIEISCNSGVFHVLWKITRTSSDQKIFHSPQYSFSHIPAWFSISLIDNSIDFFCTEKYIAKIQIGTEVVSVASSQKAFFSQPLTNLLFPFSSMPSTYPFLSNPTFGTKNPLIRPLSPNPHNRIPSNFNSQEKASQEISIDVSSSKSQSSLLLPMEIHFLLMDI